MNSKMSQASQFALYVGAVLFDVCSTYKTCQTHGMHFSLSLEEL